MHKPEDEEEELYEMLSSEPDMEGMNCSVCVDMHICVDMQKIHTRSS